MKRLIVGNKDCSVNRIVSTLDTSDNSLLRSENWKKLARELDTPRNMVSEYGQDLLSRRKDVLDVVIDLLEDWSCRLGNEAKFEQLVNILGNRCGWKDVEDEMRKTFLANIGEDITWEDLDQRSRDNIMEFPVEFQGQSMSLKNICSYFDESEIDALLQTKLKGTIILKLLRGERISLLNESVPKTSPYYIQRTLGSRRKISPEIFTNKSSDIFVVSGISLSALSQIAGKECIAKSSNQREKLTSRFIQLDFKDGFAVVAKHSKHGPVHQLAFDEKNFYWVKSSGSVSLIQEYIHTEQDSVHEKEFLAVIQEEFNKKLPVCIADSPGMGKTCLLANLARQRQLNITAGDKALLLFVTLSKFLDGVDKITQRVVCKSNVCLWIAEYASENELGQEIVSKLLQSERHKVELFFDGYDELPEHKQEFTRSMINCIANELKHVHIAMSTRVHKRHQLEQALKVLSFDIQPFQHKDQVELLQQFWNKTCGVPLNENLQRYAGFVPDTIRRTLPSTECDVLGIPLQCSMLAEIVANDALVYLNDPSLPLELSLNIKSGHDMYGALIAKKFEKCHGDDQVAMKKFHLLAAVQAVLPDTTPAFLANKILLQTNDYTNVNSLGILVVKSKCDPVQFQFLHHSYAEYMLGNILANDSEIVLENLGNLFNSVSKEDLFLEAMSLSADDPEVHVNTSEISVWDLYGKIFYSKNAGNLRKNWETLANNLHMSNADVAEIKGNLKFHISRGIGGCSWTDPLHSVLLHWTKGLQLQPKLCPLLIALRSLKFYEIAGDLKSTFGIPSFKNKNLCYFIDGSLHQTNVARTLKVSHCLSLDELVHLKNILRACIYHNFFSLFALISQYCLSIKNKQPNHFNAVSWSYLINDAVRYSTLNLMIDCCDFVKNMEELELNETECCKPLNRSVCTPLHEAAKRGDFSIFNYLFKKLGTCVLKMKSLLHCCTAYSMTNSEQVISEKIQIIQMMANTSGHFLNEKKGSRTPILMDDVHFKLLEFMIEIGADINAVDRDGNTVAHKVARRFSPSDFHMFVEFLLLRKKCTDLFYMCTNVFMCSPVNLACQFIDVKLETLQLLSEAAGNGCFHIFDWEEDDALFCAVTGLRDRSVLEMLVKCGADPKRLRKEEQTVIHKAAVNGNVQAINYFVSLGCSVNAQDVHGRTSLHLAFLFGRRNVDSTVRALLEHNAEVKVEDKDGRKAICYAESEDNVWMLEQDTKDTLQRASE